MALCQKSFLFLSITDGELHPARSHNQRYLHGVLLPGHKALSLTLYPQPFWYWKLESGRWVSFKILKPSKHYAAPASSLLILSCFFFSSISRNRVTGVYEVSLCHLADAGSPGKNQDNVIILHLTHFWNIF